MTSRSLIVQALVPLLHGDKALLGGAVQDMAGLVRHHAPGAVIEPNAAAACIVELVQDFDVSGGDVCGQRIGIGI